MKYILSIVGFIVLCSSYVFAADSWNSRNKTGTFVTNIYCRPDAGCINASLDVPLGTWFVGNHNLETSGLSEDERMITFFTSSLSRTAVINYSITVTRTESSDATIGYMIANMIIGPLGSVDPPYAWESEILNTTGISSSSSSTHYSGPDPDEACKYMLYVLVKATTFGKPSPGGASWTVTYTCTVTV